MTGSKGNGGCDREASLARFAARLRRESQFVACLLDRYARRHEVTFWEVASVLGCSARSLTRLAMCRRPSGDAPAARRQARELAQFALVDEERLYAVLSEGCDCEGAGEGV